MVNVIPHFSLSNTCSTAYLPFIISDRSYSDKVVANLLLRLEQKDEKTRIGSLHIIRHLVNSGGPQMEVKKALVISGLRLLIQEPSLKVCSKFYFIKRILPEVTKAAKKA